MNKVIRLILILMALCYALGFVTGAHAAQKPLYWTIDGGTTLPTGPLPPIHWKHCTASICIGTTGKLDGHPIQWFIGRDPVYRLPFHYPKHH